MLNKLRVTAAVAEAGVVAVLRADSAEEVVRMARHAVKGGIKAIEITMTVPGALRAIEQLAAEYSSKADPASDKHAIIGVGTVLDPETARAAILAGAEFVVAPAFNPDTIKLCNRYAVPILPGAMTIHEIQSALELGVDIVKLFPGSVYEPSVISAIKGPLPQANVMPTGGVSLGNLREWVKAGAVAVGIGGDLTKEAVKTGDFSLIERQAAAYVQAYRDAKAQ
ncbi:bifunctional 2-keto-4-hydroxyglutarate aldolase/2-keto-3-deoxy-6-phosphogluconate aldolase [Paenibacillus pasadenensis]|uniref:4-Hydroxy-2-oxoglutarate aldolase, 2-dehydro-3-deoxyphosphogluconate aldolase n=1 Tax=Paenibacillus pasadenensis TaxID=217090 RepID=A0A2N5NBU8_9BACL|nr:4-Hydroxy-2-oxoglutarate aldolase, 2-dehydro-3-deoxyphosphogluconate aldolase [Paenibacillus pasadenensis]